MSHSTAFDSTSRVSTTSRGVAAIRRNLPAAFVVLAICGVLAAFAVDRDADITQAPRLVPAPSAAPVAAPDRDPSMPDARTDFGGREFEVKETVPTF